jgi:hypothetical protein
MRYYWVGYYWVGYYWVGRYRMRRYRMRRKCWYRMRFNTWFNDTARHDSWVWWKTMSMVIWLYRMIVMT